MPSILALATRTGQWWLETQEWGQGLTIGTVKKEDRVGAAEDRNQSPVHLGRISLLGREGQIDVTMFAAFAALRRRFCDDLLVD